MFPSWLLGNPISWIWSLYSQSFIPYSLRVKECSRKKIVAILLQSILEKGSLFGDKEELSILGHHLSLVNSVNSIQCRWGQALEQWLLYCCKGYCGKARRLESGGLDCSREWININAEMIPPPTNKEEKNSKVRDLLGIKTGQKYGIGFLCSKAEAKLSCSSRSDSSKPPMPLRLMGWWWWYNLWIN